jgi:hypothetical protein
MCVHGQVDLASCGFMCISSVSDRGLVQGSGIPSASMRALKRVTGPRLIPVGDAGTVPEMNSVRVRLTV